MSQDNNLFLSVSKMKKLVIDFKKQGCAHAQVNLYDIEAGLVARMVESFKLLAVVIINNLS